MREFDVVVVGGGHAGVEAALIAAKRNKKTALITLDIHHIASMPCNPSVGGPAKGIVVREVDALGGMMGKAADATALQFKMLNSAKGVGVQALRVQSDKLAYSQYMQTVCLNTPNLTVIEDCVEAILVNDHKCYGVKTKNETIHALKVIITTGTYMASTILVGNTATESGPDGQPTTNALSESLRENGLRLFRLKTGTPARILTNSIDFGAAEIQCGSDEFVSFSYETESILPFDKQWPCYLIYTQPKTHEIIHEHIHESAMYSGLVKGVGPRYCPSIEDKLVRFADKPRHQLFLEPESKDLDTTYVQGFSTSMPHSVQDQMIHSLPGLENCVIKKYAYAIEYDAIDPLQLKPSLEYLSIDNLYGAGQINGTSGYEEAAGQGLIAGLNASLAIDGIDPLILRRDESYIGVLIDDLVTKGTKEPYRLLTSRAEFRLLLRHDNADQRLSPYAIEYGTLSESRAAAFKAKLSAIDQFKQALSTTTASKQDALTNYLISIGQQPLTAGLKAIDLLKRVGIQAYPLANALNIPVDESIAKQVEIEVKYQGYIDKAKREANKLMAMDYVKLPIPFDYNQLNHLSLEGKQKLQQIQPATLGQASRISGVNPADIAVLAMLIKQGDIRCESKK